MKRNILIFCVSVLIIFATVACGSKISESEKISSSETSDLDEITTMQETSINETSTSKTSTNESSTEHVHNWIGNNEVGLLVCKSCGEYLMDDEIKEKKGEDLTSAEKARIYWVLDETLTERTSAGKYMYTEEECFEMAEEEFGVTESYLKNNIWNGHAYDDYVKYYIH